MKYKNKTSGTEFNEYTTGFIAYSGFVKTSIKVFNRNAKSGNIIKIPNGPLKGLYADRTTISKHIINGEEVYLYCYPHLISVYKGSHPLAGDIYTPLSELETSPDILGNTTFYSRAFTLSRIIFKDRLESIYTNFQNDGNKYTAVGDTLYIENSVLDCEDTLDRIRDEYDLVYTVEGNLRESCDCTYIESESEFYLKNDDEICYVEEYDKYMLRDDCIYSERLDVWVHTETDMYIYCSDIEDYVYYDDAFYDESSGEYLSERPESPAHIAEYHRSPSSNVIYNPTAGSHKYGIGFEVEKNSILGKSHEGDYIGEYKFFSGFENDASCGVEGISNIYCLEYGYDTLKEHVKEAKDILNDNNVDSNCGGHINVSGPSDIVNLANIRKYSGLLFAMYRYRLQKSYSSHNKKLEEYNKNTKYSAIREKNNSVGYNRTLIEFRLISRVEHSNQILFRYKLIQKLIKAVEKGISFEEYLSDNQSLLKIIYSEEKLRRINAMAISFNSWINAEHEFIEDSQENIKQFI
jgi:hypothetical protein